MRAVCNHFVTAKKRIYSIKELVSEVGGTVWYWRQAIWNGELPVVKFGRKQMVDIQDVERFIQKHKESISV